MPKPPSGKILIREFRVTPYDQNTIDFTTDKIDLIDKMIICREGSPNGEPKLHYHGYIETRMAETSLRLMLRTWSNPPAGTVNGNALYFTRQVHDNTIGYIIKNRDVVVNIGFTQTQIEDYFKKSDDYMKKKATDKKRSDRNRYLELNKVLELVKEDIANEEIFPRADAIIERILYYCYIDNIRFPAKVQMEQIVLKLLYPFDKEFVKLYYLRPFAI